MSQPRSGARTLSLIAPSALSVNSSTDQGGGKRRGELGYNNEAAPDAGPLFNAFRAAGGLSRNPARVLRYFFFDLAFFFMALFLAVGPLTRSKGWCRADERGLNRLWRGPQQITGGHWIPAFMASVLAPAAWRYSPPSALDRALAIVNCPAKLFDEGLSRRQIRKTPAIKRLAFLQNYMAVSQLDMSRIVKVHDPTA